MIIYCDKCHAHEYQDKKYGVKMRVANIMKDITKARCSVCGSTLSVQKQIVVEKKEK